MKINWFTVVAEIINFLVLVWLLKRFLYKPVLNAIDEREKKIAAQIQDAENKKADAKKEQDDFRKKNEEFDRQKKGLMDKAIADTNADHDKLLEAARNDASALRSKLEKAAKDNEESEAVAIAQKTQEQVLAIARKTLSDIASVSLEQQSVSIFIRRLKASTNEEKKQFTDAFKSNANTILVQSAFELPAPQQTEINQAVNEVLCINTSLQFKTAPGLISGIELSTNGYKLAWSIKEYLSSLEKTISEKTKDQRAAATENV
jgi:F-type H+-transporting ATPase subunit b